MTELKKENLDIGFDNFNFFIKKYKFENLYVIQRLIIDLESKTNLNYWANNRIHNIIPSKINSNNYFSKASKLLASIRNLLVFVPVALTWLAVSKATSSFANFIDDNSGTTANFLQFWQNGYGYLEDTWKIGHIAFLDFIIILIVIIISIFSSYFNLMAKKQTEKELNEFNNLRNSAVLDIEIYLSKLSSNKNSNSDFLRLSNQFELAINKIEDVGFNAAELSSLLVKLISKIQEQSHDLNLTLNQKTIEIDSSFKNLIENYNAYLNKLENEILRNFEFIKNKTKIIDQDLRDINNFLSKTKNKIQKFLGL